MKAAIKSQESEKNPINNPINTPLGYSISPKSKREINRENYFKHAEERKERQRQRYAKKKEQEQERVSQYSRASDYQVLISLKEYTELNPAKHKKLLDFIWTFKSFLQAGEPVFSNVLEVMRLNELGENLISDYWHTAKNEIKKGKNWNSLDQEQKDRLIKYWGREKARGEQAQTEAIEEIARKGKWFESEVEMAKFHEERGKVNCKCWQCEQKAVFSKEVKAKIKKEIEELEPEIEKGECLICGKFKELDEEGACKKCESQLE